MDENEKLFAAIERGDVTGVSQALADGASLRAWNRHAKRPATVAASLGRVECLEALRQAGADWNVVDGANTSPLEAALRQPQALAWLLERGADPNLRDRHGNSALTVASRDGLLESIELLLDSGADIERACAPKRLGALAMAATAGQPAAMSLLLARGADPDARDDQGQTVAIRAARGCAPKCMELLIQAGADLQAKDDEGLDALAWCRRTENDEGAAMILAALEAAELEKSSAPGASRAPARM